MTLLNDLGIGTCQVTYGKEASFAGINASAKISIVPMIPGGTPLQLVWAATGDIFTDFPDQSTAAGGVVGTIALPWTDQSGFIIPTSSGPQQVTNWYYLVVVTSNVGSESRSRTYRLQIPTGTTSLDLDQYPQNQNVSLTPVYLPIPTTGGPASGVLSGSFPSPGLNATAVDNFIAAHIGDPTSATYQALLAFLAGAQPVTPDNAFVTDTGDYLVTDTGDFLIAA